MGKKMHLEHRRDILVKKEQKAHIAERKDDGVMAIGEAYSVEQIQELLSGLESDEAALSTAAMVEFIDNNEAISEGAMQTTEYTKSDIAEAFSEALERNGGALVRSLESEGSVERLQFVAESAYVPQELQIAAESALERLGVRVSESPGEAAMTVGQSGAEPLAVEKEGRAIVQAVIASLESPDEEERIQACAGFLTHYSEIIQFASDEPLLTVTEVKENFTAALSESPAEVVAYLEGRGMSAELELLSKIPAAPEEVRTQAREALSEIEAGRSETGQTPVAETPAPKPARKQPKAAKITEAKMEQLLSALESPEPEVASEAVIECMKSYDAVVEFLSGSPIATVTKFSDKLFSAFATHFELVFKLLQERKESGIVEFLILSSRTPASIRRRAMRLRRAMDHPEGERQ